MALIPCIQCGHKISPQAAACPQCGHPISVTPPPIPKTAISSEARKPQSAVAIGCGIVLLALAVLVIWAANEGRNLMEAEKANPTCVSDYAKCADNEELVNKHQSRDHVSISIECAQEAKKIARYGTPELPFLAFHRYSTGRAFIDSGTATLIEPDASYKNGFNASQNVTAICTYNLREDRTSIELIPK